jgi:hypothetical protein
MAKKKTVLGVLKIEAPSCAPAQAVKRLSRMQMDPAPIAALNTCGTAKILGSTFLREFTSIWV